MTDVAAIARGLTEHMRNALVWPKEPRLVVNTLYSATINGLIGRRLVDDQYRLTPLGLAVRAHLASADMKEGE